MSDPETTAGVPSEQELADVVTNYSRVKRAVEACADSRSVRLVAVGKTKHVSMIQAVYRAGHRDFGENYVNELCDKAEFVSKAGPEYADISWHFIGALQTNKAKKLVAAPNLCVVETVDREKVANALEKACADVGRHELLKVFVQVNVSGEDSKSGCAPTEAPALCAHVRENCPHLKLAGLMTIGKPDDSEQPQAFSDLLNVRQQVASALQLDLTKEPLELSMGMSNDFERAIRMHSTNVRVGSTIFGARLYADQK
ncbi:Proline synthase co-transcribed bacterial-like protein [Porphyridium purpureum]|uniref:Pyridoxal phosphate homeostasis protein n=1 Tax=Porphyridium purpureum TaxID=35688 RepID=A0A5J4YVL6_PORPP|nr:Proline synthase co-transcribed bacterial-like protein [Porphyridium purpureum]|eukprot:POR5725..scf209_3